MEINAIFDNVKIYSVQNRLDVKLGERFQLEILEPLPEGFDVFANQDPVLTIEDNLVITASNLGESKIRFMSGTSVVKDLLIVVVNQTAGTATGLNSTLGEAQPK